MDTSAESQAAFWARFNDTVAAFFETKGEEYLGQMKDIIGVPGETVDGERIRSSPGEPPRWWNGEYFRTMSCVVEESDGKVTMEIGTTHPKGPVLEFGGIGGTYFIPDDEIEARPHWVVLYNQIIKDLPTALTTALQSVFNDESSSDVPF